MGFGLFKKIKDFTKKGINWLKKITPKAKKFMDTVTPAIKQLPNEKVKNYFDLANSGINAIDNAINKQKYDDVKNWINYEIRPKLKH